MKHLERSVIALCSALLFVFIVGCTDPLSVRQKCFRNANKYYDKGKYKEASILYRRALQLDAKYADAWYRLGLTALKLGDYAQALAALRRAVELDANNDDACIRLADLYLGAGLSGLNEAGFKAVISEFRSLVDRLKRKDPRSYDVLRLSAYLNLAEHNRKAAIQSFRGANEVKPWQPEVVLALTETLAVDGQMEEAERFAKELLERHKDFTPIYSFLYTLYSRTSRLDRAEAILMKRVENVPEDGRSRVLLALHYYATNQSQEMLGVIQHLRNDRKDVPGADGLIGDFYVRIGDLSNAIQAYREGEKFNPKEKTAYEVPAIEALVAQGKVNEAMDAAERLYKANPKDLGIAALRAMLLARMDAREIDNAIRALESFASKQPQNSLIQFYLGRAYRDKGGPQNLGRAQSHLELCTALLPSFLPAKTMLLEVRLLQRDTQGAVRIADDILRSDPGNLDARLARALAFVLQARPDQAREDLLTALAIHKGSNEARLRLAILDLSQKRYREAEKGFAMVVQAGDPRGSIGLAQSRAAQGHVTAAIEDLRKECASFPALYECQSALASMELRTGQFPEAKDGFERLIQRNPNAAEPYLGLAEAQVKLGDSAGALATFRKARQVDPSNAQAILGIAVLLDTSGQKAQAAAAYQEVLAINSGNAMALNNLAYIKAEQGVDLDRALAMAQSAVQKSPENPDYLDTLGLVYYKRSLIAASIDVFERLVTKKPNNPSFHLHMAMALYAARKTDLAAGELQKAMLYKPSQVEQIEIRDLAMKLHLPTERMESR